MHAPAAKDDMHDEKKMRECGKHASGSFNSVAKNISTQCLLKVICSMTVHCLLDVYLKARYCNIFIGP